MALGEVIKFKEAKEKKDIVELKGSKKGLIINVKEGYEFDAIKESIIKKFESNESFFKGAKVVSINCKMINDLQLIELKDIIIERFNIEFVEENEEIEDVFNGIYEGNTKFVKNTLRSGVKIKFNGNVVIIGDVNPGAEVIANGNIVVMGSLRGIAHAGANGNKEVFVVAYNLDPMQLRIGDIIGIAPDENGQKPNCPEIAFIRDNCIVIEPYLIKR